MSLTLVVDVSAGEHVLTVVDRVKRASALVDEIVVDVTGLGTAVVQQLIDSGIPVTQTHRGTRMFQDV